MCPYEVGGEGDRENREERRDKFGTLRKGGENGGNCTFRKCKFSNDPRDDPFFFSSSSSSSLREIERGGEGLRPSRIYFIYIYVSRTIFSVALIRSSGGSNTVINFFPPRSRTLTILSLSPSNFTRIGGGVYDAHASPSFARFARDLENIGGYKRASGYINSVARLNTCIATVYVNIYIYKIYIYIKYR